MLTYCSIFNNRVQSHQFICVSESFRNVLHHNHWNAKISITSILHKVARVFQRVQSSTLFFVLSNNSCFPRETFLNKAMLEQWKGVFVSSCWARHGISAGAAGTELSSSHVVWWESGQLHPHTNSSVWRSRSLLHAESMASVLQASTDGTHPKTASCCVLESWSSCLRIEWWRYKEQKKVLTVTTWRCFLDIQIHNVHKATSLWSHSIRLSFTISDNIIY